LRVNYGAEVIDGLDHALVDFACVAIWIGFYWQRGLVRFLIGAAAMVALLVLALALTSSDTSMFLAGLQDIPPTLYEAASIDGANKWQQFVKITVPMLRPVILLIVVLGTIGTWQVFDTVKILTSGGPLDTTLVPVYLIYSEGLGINGPPTMGYACAMAFLLALIIFTFTFIQRRFIESGTEAY